MDNRTLIEQFFAQERISKRNITLVLWSVVVLADIYALFAFIQGVNAFQIVQYLSIPVALCFILLWFSLHRNKTLQERLTMLLDSIEFGWDELHGVDLNPSEADRLHLAFTSTTVGRITTNEPYLRTRGTDEKGPAFDSDGADINPKKERTDASLHEGDYEGLEDELRISEQLVEEANQHYAEEAQRQWDIAEKRDMDMVEEGIERLGDLVASGWFERNPKDGALRELMETAEEDEIR